MNSLTERRLRPLLRALAQREDELRRLVTEERARIEEDSVDRLEDPACDDVDRADARTRVALESRMIDHYLSEIDAHAAARDRVESGTFGVCVDCGTDIDYRRLRAVPATARCAVCQSRHERLLMPRP